MPRSVTAGKISPQITATATDVLRQPSSMSSPPVTLARTLFPDRYHFNYFRGTVRANEPREYAETAARCYPRQETSSYIRGRPARVPGTSMEAMPAHDAKASDNIAGGAHQLDDSHALRLPKGRTHFLTHATKSVMTCFRLTVNVSGQIWGGQWKKLTDDERQRGRHG